MVIIVKIRNMNVILKNIPNIVKNINRSLIKIYVATIIKHKDIAHINNIIVAVIVLIEIPFTKNSTILLTIKTAIANIPKTIFSFFVIFFTFFLIIKVNSYLYIS